VVDRLGLVGLALLHGQGTGDVFYPVLPQLVDAQAQVGPLEGGPVPHLLGGSSGGGHRPVDVGLRGDGNVGDVLAGDGRGHRVNVVAGAVGELSVDVQLHVAGHGGQDTLARCPPGIRPSTSASAITAPGPPGTCSPPSGSTVLGPWSMSAVGLATPRPSSPNAGQVPTWWGWTRRRR